MANLTNQKPRQKMPRERNKDYLGFIAALPCVLCGDQAECAHVRFAEICPDCGGTKLEEFDVAEAPLEPNKDAIITRHYQKCTPCKGTGYCYGKRPVGAGEKPSDWWVLPLCPKHHRLANDSQHAQGDERMFWLRWRIYPLWLCTRLQDAYNCSPDRATAIQAGLGILEGLK